VSSLKEGIRSVNSPDWTRLKVSGLSTRASSLISSRPEKDVRDRCLETTSHPTNTEEMATAPPSSLFTSLTGVWRLLALRSDVDDIIIELLGRFDLEKIYADSNKDVYADLILALLAQLDVIFFIQRLTLPALDRSPAGWSLGFLVSWEVTLRTVEFILQTVLEAREVLWDASFRDEYLARLLLSTVRILLLHPKPPANSKARDRRDRFVRIQRSLERICDSYPDTSSPLLSVCRAIADTLCSAPDTLTLPPRLKNELPSLSEDLVSPPSPARLRSFG
jgi:hypothetical protein